MMDLFDGLDELEEPTPDQPHHLDGRSIQEHFEEFHENHPEVYDELVKLCRQGRARGQRQLAIVMLFEVIRYGRIMAGLPHEGEGFKLNNNYRSRYARLIMAKEPDLAGVFRLRVLRAE